MIGRRVGRSGLLCFGLLVLATGCTSEPWGCGMGAACPALADVGDTRYSISVGLELVDVEDDLTAFGQVSQTNVPEYFAETTVFSVAGIDPLVLLVARAAPHESNEGPYRILNVFQGDGDSIWPAFCRYLSEYRRTAQPECGPSATP